MAARDWRVWRPSRRLLVGFVMLGLLPLAILTTSSIVLAKAAVRGEAVGQVTVLAATTSAMIANQLTDNENALLAAAAARPLQTQVSEPRTEPRARRMSFLSTLLGSQSDFTQVFTTDSVGNVIDVASRTSIGPLPNMSDSDWYRVSAGSDKPSVSDGFMPSTTGLGWVFSISIRVPSATQPSETGGFLVGLSNLSALRKMVNVLTDRQSAFVSVQDRDGVVLAAPGVSGTQSGFLSSARPLTDVLSARVTVPGLGWTVTADVPQRLAFRDYYVMEATVVIIAGLLGVLMLIALGLLARSRNRRLAAELAAAERSRIAVAREVGFQSVFVHAPVGMARETPDGTILDVNVAFCELLAMTEAELVGRTWQSLTHPDDLESSADIDALLPYADRSVAGEKRYLRPNGDVIWALVSVVSLTDTAGDPYVLAQAVDISDRKRAEDALNRQALHDGLTGLPNRLLIESRLEHALQRLTRDPHSSVAMMFVDLDGFKAINDRLGHQVGDDVLRELGQRIVATLRPGDTVARLGGDEFLVLCEGFPGNAPVRDGIDGIAHRILDAVQQPGGADERTWQVGASIGVSIAGLGRSDLGGPAAVAIQPATLVAEADTAMYHAKRHGKNRIEYFEPSMAQEKPAAPRAMALVSTALEQSRLRLHYQPVYELGTRRIVGAEALLRMVDIDGRLLAPAEFLAAAEAHGQIVDFGAWSLMQACQQAASWKQALPSGAEFCMAVNISVKEMEDTNFLYRLDRALDESGLSPDALVIELTESAFLRDLPSGRAAIEGIRQRGVQLALDDFGTGFSSLSYLRRFQVDIIKLDRSFVSDLVVDRRGDMVTRALIGLIHSLQALMVVEGIETEEQAEALLGLGAQLAQGYLLSRPVSVAEFSALLDAQCAATVEVSSLTG